MLLLESSKENRSGEGEISRLRKVNRGNGSCREFLWGHKMFVEHP